MDQGGTIYYTLDGSEPDASALVYRSPIEVVDRGNEPNDHSTITTSTYPIVPRGLVNKGLVVRAVVVVEGKAPSDIVTHTYWVDEKQHERYTFPIIALSMSPEDLFNYERGIYVPGKIYEDAYDERKEPWERPANYTQRGREWERAAHVEFFEQDGTLAFSQDIGVRIHGGATRSSGQKTLRLYARGSYDKEGWFRYAVFPGHKKADGVTPIDDYKRFILRNSGNDWHYTMFRDAMMQSLVAHTGIDTQESRPAVVFLNGEYWGIHNIRERYDQYYLESTYDIPRSDVVILEGGGDLSYGEPGDEAHYHMMLDYLRRNNIAEEHHYAYIQTLMDVENYMDYQISQIYFANHDWPGNNIQFWRARTDAYIEGAGYKDGRWRWMLYDTDFGFSLYNGRNGYTHPTLSFAVSVGGHSWPNPDWSTFLLRNLLKNDSFRKQFASRFADHLNSSFSPDRVISVINDFEEQYQPEIKEHIDRWRTPDTYTRWLSNVEDLRYFAKKRPEAMFQQLDRELRLGGTVQLRLDADASKGYIVINSLVLSPETPGVHEAPYPWTGTYFKDVEIRLQALPREGYRFAGWKGIDGGVEEVSLKLDRNRTISAVFEPLEGISGVREKSSVIYLTVAGVIVLLLLVLLLAIRVQRKRNSRTSSL